MEEGEVGRGEGGGERRGKEGKGTTRGGETESGRFLEEPLIFFFRIGEVLGRTIDLLLHFFSSHPRGRVVYTQRG